MLPHEMVECAITVYGPDWRSQLAKAMDETLEAIQAYERGRAIPEDFAGALREMTAVGPAGEVIKRGLKRICPEQPDHKHHETARDFELRLYEADVLHPGKYKEG
jgi:hypothetical protein